MAERIVRLRITGLVQAVGFRVYVEGAARRLAARGWVRNRRDGSVEAVVAGAPDVVGEFIAACRAGPPGAQVESVAVEEADETSLSHPALRPDFSVLPTV
ncbi:MAG: acylphosphatase [Hyphomonadaceae bacterium]